MPSIANAQISPKIGPPIADVPDLSLDAELVAVKPSKLRLGVDTARPLTLDKTKCGVSVGPEGDLITLS